MKAFTHNLCKSISLAFFACLYSFAAQAATIHVTPSGDTGGDADANNIQNALDSAGPGDRVSLGAGDYYINRPIIASDYHGALIGQGKNVTVINAVEDQNNPCVVTSEGFVQRNEPACFNSAVVPETRIFTRLNNTAAFFIFVNPQQSLKIKGMSLVVPEELVVTPTPVFPNLAPGLKAFIDIRFTNPNAQSNIQIKDMILLGTNEESNPDYAIPINFAGANAQPLFGIVIAGDATPFQGFPPAGPFDLNTNTELKIKNVQASNVGLEMLNIIDFEKSKIKIINNDFSNAKQLVITRMIDSLINIKNNIIDFQFRDSIVLNNSPDPDFNARVEGEKNIVRIKNNTITSSGESAIAIREVSEINPNSGEPIPNLDVLSNFKVRISNNQLTMVEPQTPEGFPRPPQAVISTLNNDSALIKCNVLSGTSATFGIFLIDSDNNKLIRNNVDNLTVSEDHYVFTNMPDPLRQPELIVGCADNNLVKGVGTFTTSDSCLMNHVRTTKFKHCGRVGAEDDDSGSDDSSSDSSNSHYH